MAGSTTTRYIFSGTKVIAEYVNGAAVGSPTKEYIYSGSQLLVTLTGSTPTYHHQDHLSVRVNTNSSGTTVGAQEPFQKQMFLADGKPPQGHACLQALTARPAPGFLADTSFDATLVYMAETRCRAEVVFERNESGWLVPERQADISTPCDFTNTGWVDLWRRWENKQRLVLYLCKRHARELGLKW